MYICIAGWPLRPWAQLYSSLRCGGKEAVAVECPWAARVAGSSHMAEAGSAAARFTAVFRMPVGIGREGITAGFILLTEAGVGDVLRMVITLTVIGAEDIPGATDTALSWYPGWGWYGECWLV